MEVEAEEEEEEEEDLVISEGQHSRRGDQLLLALLYS